MGDRDDVSTRADRGVGYLRDRLVASQPLEMHRLDLSDDLDVPGSDLGPPRRLASTAHEPFLVAAPRPCRRIRSGRLMCWGSSLRSAPAGASSWPTAFPPLQYCDFVTQHGYSASLDEEDRADSVNHDTAVTAAGSQSNTRGRRS